MFLSFGAGAADLIVPDQYSQVSEALAVAVSGDAVLVRPGQYTDSAFWNIKAGIAVVGLGESPADVKYLVPRGVADAIIILNTDCRLENIQVGTQFSATLIHTSAHARNMIIRNVVCAPITSCAIYYNDDTTGEVSYVTICGGTSDTDVGMSVGANSTGVVRHCVLQNLRMGISGSEGFAESWNLFWNVGTPVGSITNPRTPDPSDIVNVADPMLDPVTFVPGYQSPAVDSGDPGYFDPDGTAVDRGAVYRSQVLYTLEFLADPKDEVKIGLPRRQGLPARMFHAGDRFVLGSRLVKTENPPHLTADPTVVYLALECYGTFYWAPSWTTEVDSRNVAISDGYDEQTTVFDFIWPVVSGSANGLHLWATSITSAGWVGPVACLEFGYE